MIVYTDVTQLLAGPLCWTRFSWARVSQMVHWIKSPANDSQQLMHCVLFLVSFSVLPLKRMHFHKHNNKYSNMSAATVVMVIRGCFHYGCLRLPDSQTLKLLCV